MKRYLLVGNYGAGNLGDGLLKEYFLRTFTGAHFCVISAHPGAGELHRLPGGIRSFLSFRWVRTLLQIRRSDGVVFGGGSLFTDVESICACFIWGIYALAALVFCKPYFLAFQGIGPFRMTVSQHVTRFVVRHAAFVSVRDTLSIERVQAWSLNKKVIHSFDPVFSLIQKEKYDIRSNNVLILVPRNRTSTMFQNRSSELMTKWHDIRTLRFEEGESPVRSLVELLDALSGAAFILSERYHAAIAALALGIPFEVIPQALGDKLDALRLMTQAGAQREELTALIREGENALKTALQ